MPRLRHDLHPRTPPGRANGVLRRRLCCLLSLPTPGACKMTTAQDFTLSCPIPISEYPHVLLAHGGGGALMHKLIEKMFVPAFSNPLLEGRHDGATFNVKGARLAFTTDSHVVHPLFFPGGDIGTLAVNGTVNDPAMRGAGPRYLSAGVILEEGLPMENRWRVVQSRRWAADEASVQLVT